MNRTIPFVTGLTLIFVFCLAAFANDPPHNDDSGVSCGECHGDILFTTDPGGLTPDELKALYNDMCMRCHVDTSGSYHSNGGPLVDGHTSAVTQGVYTFNTSCIDCHHPHYQTPQFWYGRKYFGSQYRLFAGQGSVNGGLSTAARTVIDYNPASVSPKSGSEWDTTGYPEFNAEVGLASLAAKTDTGRGAIFLPNTASPYNSRIIESIDIVNNRITVKGTVGSVASAGFAIAYGQAIKRDISYATANGWPVEYLDRQGTKSFADDESNSGTDATPNGICQSCHTETRFWRNNGAVSWDKDNDLPSSAPHYSAQNCTLCHPHVIGFAHGGDGGGPTCGTSGCHESQSHARHLNAGYQCSDCHAINNYLVRNESDFILFNDSELLGDTAVCNDCHNSKPAWGGSACLSCHVIAQNDRAAIGAMFSDNSHHVQGTAVTDLHCYQCHWEADGQGHIYAGYHGGVLDGDAAVDLVIYGAGSRPAAYASGTTATTYTAANMSAGLPEERQEVGNVTLHCLGCHSNQNNTTQPFGDGKTPRTYAWDELSVGARYSQTGTALWGKYDNATYPNVTPKNKRTKAYSAHGNATVNEGGWDTNETWPNTRNGSNYSIQCFDCHNSHGSSVAGTTTSYDDVSATTNSGILKDTTGGGSGYPVLYKPVAGGTAEDKNIRNPGASLCFDCHLTADGSAAGKPWGYHATFEDSQAIIGYFDSEFLKAGQSGSQQRYTYKGMTTNAGGHFGHSTAVTGDNPTGDMRTVPTHQINGLCTPCHDPHGVSPFLDVNQQYGVPLLKGTWVTSPYKEDAAPASAAEYRPDGSYVGSTPGFHIDQNTFANNIFASTLGIDKDVSIFAGLCLKCHEKSGIDPDGGTQNNGWGTMDRVHETVYGWGANNKHKFSCSKCHTPHNGSALPRLMVTNCLGFNHRGRVAGDGVPTNHVSGWVDSDDCDLGGEGFGKFPGGGHGSGEGCEDGGSSSYGFGGVACHDSVNGSVSWPDNQAWNNVTPWTIPPEITSGPTTVSSGLKVLLHMNEASWSGIPNEVYDISGNSSHGQAFSGATTIDGGLCGRAGSFNGTTAYVGYNYSSSVPVNNFTLEAWIKPNTTHEVDAESRTGVGGTAGQRYLFWPEYQNSTIYAGVGVSAGTNGISVYEHASGYMPALAVYSGTISSTEWTHVAVVYFNKRPSIYVNGTLVSTGQTSLRQNLYAPTKIGFGSTYGNFSGEVDEVAVYNRALTGPEIQALYQYQQTCPTVPITSTIQWTTLIKGNTCVDYGLSGSYGSTECTGAQVTAHTMMLTGLDNHSTYHYRVRSANSEGEDMSGDNTFSFSLPPTTPAPIDEPNAVCAGSCNVPLEWNGSIDPDDGPIEYQVEVDGSAAFNTGSKQTSAWIGDPTTSWTPPSALATNKTWYFRVRARDGNYITAQSAWSNTDSFILSDGVAPPQVTLSSPLNGAAWGGCDGTAYMSFVWAAVPAMAQYQVHLSLDPTFTTVDYPSGWRTATSWAVNIPSIPDQTYYWRVQARDPVGGATGAWSLSRSVNITDLGPCDSCPFVFTWNGTEYEYVTDVQGPVIGLPSVTPAARSVGLFQPASVVLDSLVPDSGKYRLKLRETLREISYLDEVKLLVVDHPPGYELVSSTAENTYSYGYANPETIYTVKDPRPPVSAFDTNGDDILGSVTEVDNVFAPLDYDIPEYITLDFGIIEDPANAKLVIDGWTVYSAALRTGYPVQPHVEVLDATGNWVEVVSFGEPAGDLKRMAVPLGNHFQNPDQRIRLHLGKKSGGRWRLDRVLLDESVPVAITVQEVDAEYADLYHGGMVPRNPNSMDSRIFAEDGSLADDPDGYGYGSFTRYGDVLPLLSSIDDKFVIMRHGDAVDLEFAELGAPQEGLERSYLLKIDLYYKSFRVENNVEPLPFHGMSIYPPAAGESYPDDPEHVEYLQTYNTRLF